MNKYFKHSLVALFVVLLFISCNDDPSSVGSNLIPDEDKIQFVQFDSRETQIIQQSSFHEANIKLGTAERILLGKTSYAESVMMLRYNVILVDSLMNYLKDGQLAISKVWLDLYPSYQLGDKSANYNFSIHQIRSDWGPEGFDKDSIKTLQYDQTNVGLSNTLVLTDTLINVQLQSNVLKEWFKYRYDSLNTPKNYGLIFKPTSNTQRVIGFNGLQLDASKKLPTLSAIIEKAPTFIDTISFTPIIDVHVVTGSLPTSNDKMYLQGGQSLRSILYFDLNSIPKNIILNKAMLELSIDTLNTINGTPKSDTIIVQALLDRTAHKLNSDSLLYLTLLREGSIYTGDVSWLTQKWLSLSDSYKNEGILLSLFDEKTSISRITLFGSNDSDPYKRPRLKLIYTQKK